MAFVQSKSASGAAAASQAVTFTGTPVVGNFIVVAIMLNLAGGVTVSTVADNKGNSYTKAKAQAFGVASADDLEIWYAVAATSTATFTVTVTPTGTAAISVAIHEYSRVRTTTPLDKTASASGTSTAADSGATATLTVADELVFAAVGTAGAVPTITTGGSYNLRETPSIVAVLALGTEDEIVTATTAVHGTFTLAPSSLWGAIVATFIEVDDRTSAVGVIADVALVQSNDRTSAAGVIADIALVQSNDRTSSVGVMVDGVWPGTERYTSAVGVMVDGVFANTYTFEGDGTLTPTGALVKSNAKTFAGTLTPAGLLLKTKLVIATFSGTLAPSGELDKAKIISVTLNGVLTPSGELDRLVERNFSGTLHPTGALQHATAVTLSGNLTPVGELHQTYPNEMARLSQLVVEVGDGGVSAARVSQLAIEAGIIAYSYARLSQIVVEVAVAPLILPNTVCGQVTAPVRVWINMYNTQGQMVAMFDDWKTLDIVHTVNNYSVVILSIDGDDPRVPLFATDNIIEVWRQVGSYQYVESTSLNRVERRQLTTDQHAIYTSTSRGLLDLVRRRFVMYPIYPAVTPATLKQGPMETMLKEIVNENVGPGAVAPRFLYGVTPGFTIQADAALGPVITVQLSRDDILAAINKVVLITDIIGDIATMSKMDFDVVRTGPVTFEFRTYFPQRGLDRSAYLAFAPELGNMVNPDYTRANDTEINSIIVLGPGTGNSQRMLPLVGTDTTDSPWNVVEGVVDAGGAILYNTMLAAGNTSLALSKPKETFTFDVLQTDRSIYGRDYNVGDIITARFGTISKQTKIIGANVSIAAGVETVKLTFADLP